MSGRQEGADAGCPCRLPLVFLSPEHMQALEWGSSQCDVCGVRTQAVRAPQLCHFLALEREFHLCSRTRFPP